MTFVTAVANADYTLATDSAEPAETWATSDADSRRTFQNDVVEDFELAVLFYDGLMETTSSAYRLAEAQAHKIFVAAVADASHTHTTTVAGATTTWINSMASARRTHVLDELDAEEDHADA